MRKASSTPEPVEGLAVTPNTQRHQHREAGRLPVQAHPDDRAVEDQADDVVPGKIALLPGFPVGVHLVPSPAHHVFADGAAEQRPERPAHPPGVGAGEIGGGDQRLGTPGQPLIGRDSPVVPFRGPAVRPGQARPRHRYADRAKGANQLALAMPVAVAARGTLPVIAAALQDRVQLGLQHLLDKPANARAHRPFQRIEPILILEWLRRARCSNLVHGVILSLSKGRRRPVSRPFGFNSNQEITPPVNSHHLRDTTCRCRRL